MALFPIQILEPLAPAPIQKYTHGWLVGSAVIQNVVAIEPSTTSPIPDLPPNDRQASVQVCAATPSSTTLKRHLYLNPGYLHHMFIHCRQQLYITCLTTCSLAASPEFILACTHWRNLFKKPPPLEQLKLRKTPLRMRQQII